MEPETPLLASLPSRGNLVHGACLLSGAPRKLVCCAALQHAKGHRVVRTEVVSLDQWYRRSLRFRSSSASRGRGTTSAGGAPGLSSGSSAAAPSAPRARAAPGEAGAAGPLEAAAAAAAVAAPSGKRPAQWAAGEGDAGAPQDQQRRKRPAAAGGGGTAGAAAPAAPAAAPPRPGAAEVRAAAAPKAATPPGGAQQQRAAPPPAVRAPGAAPAAAAAGAATPRAAAARREHFTPEQLHAKTAKELSDMLRARGQAAAGRKEQLVIRLLDYQRRLRRAMQPADGAQ